MSRAYYNEIDPYAAAWLRNLIRAGFIPPGDVDQRSIADVTPTDVAGYTQCHFFAGIAGWALALHLAGWPHNRPVWTGSCPCQPLSSAGQRKGHLDQRHLWPAFYALIAQRRPATIFGEQVAGKDGREWLAGIRADLESAGYAVGAADLCAASVGAPHIRQRLFWVANADEAGSGFLGSAGLPTLNHTSCRDDTDRRGPTGWVAHTAENGWRPRPGNECQPEGWPALADNGSPTRRLADASEQRRQQERPSPPRHESQNEGRQTHCDHIAPGHGADSRLGNTQAQGRQIGTRLSEMDGSPSREGFEQTNLRLGAWSGATWLPCLDGKARRIEPGILPLAHGVPNRVGKLRAAGNAIVPQTAALFIRAFLETGPDWEENHV